MPKKEKIADILVSTILNSNGGLEGSRTPVQIPPLIKLYMLIY